MFAVGVVLFGSSALLPPYLQNLGGYSVTQAGLLMTPRGVADVNVYTPERVEARYGVTPDQVPDFIGLKGDTSDNIPGVPGIGDKTAAELLQRFGSLESVLNSIDEISGAKRKQNLTEHADDARISKVLATAKRDIEIDFDLDIGFLCLPLYGAIAHANVP